MTSQEIIDKLDKPFIIDWWPEDCYAHRDNDYEHYFVIWFDPKRKRPVETTWCEAGVCGQLPFENVEAEFDKFDDMGKKNIGNHMVFLMNL